MMFYVFFKERCDGITVHHGLDALQPASTRLQVRESRWWSCKKLTADNSVVTEIAVVHPSKIRFIVTAIRYSGSSGKVMWYNHSVYSRWGSSTHRVKQLFSFGDKRIKSRKFPTAWPSKSSDLDVYDFWLQKYHNTMVYRDLWHLYQILKIA